MRPLQFYRRLSSLRGGSNVPLGKRHRRLLPTKTVVNLASTCHEQRHLYPKDNLQHVWFSSGQTNGSDADTDADHHASAIMAAARTGDVQQALASLEALSNGRNEGTGNILTTTEFNAVMDVWAHSPFSDDSAKDAEDLLDKYVELYKLGRIQQQPDALAFRIVMKSYALANRMQEAERVQAKLLEAQQDGIVGEASNQP